MRFLRAYTSKSVMDVTFETLFETLIQISKTSLSTTKIWFFNFFYLIKTLNTTPQFEYSRQKTS